MNHITGEVHSREWGCLNDWHNVGGLHVFLPTNSAVLAPGSLTTIHTWAQVALETYIKASWVKTHKWAERL